MNRILEVFLVFLRLGCTSFGGPVAHVGYFQAEFVEKRRWITLETFTELVALAQSLPGPASSQVGYSVGLLRAGLPGGLAAWLGFTLPSVLLMLAFAFGHSLFSSKAGTSILHGLQLAAVAVVAQAVLTMQRNLAPDRVRLALACVAVAVVLFIHTPAATLFAILIGALAGFLLKDEPALTDSTDSLPPVLSKPVGSIALFLFAAFLTGSLLLSNAMLTSATLFSSFFRAGALVFGGGHVVLLLLNAFTVAHGWISEQKFLAGYGAAQALPGPLFAYSAFLGATVQPNIHPFLNCLLSVLGIFLPGLLLITGALPFWGLLRKKPQVRRALRGINAAVVGVLIAALYNPIWSSSVHSTFDFVVVLGAFVLLVQWRIQPWVVVLLAGSINGFCGA